MATEKTELEGFICPICFKDLGSMYHLHGHFETDHPDEDTAIVDQIKGNDSMNSFLYFSLFFFHFFSRTSYHPVIT